MTVSADKKVWTDEEFLALSKDGHRYEIVDGELVDMGNSGMEHGDIGSFLGGSLALYVRRNKLGSVCDSSTAFSLKTGNKRSPDVSFVSPGNTVEEMHDKIVEYFENGARLVWVIHPDERYVLVYREPVPDRLLKVTDQLDGEEVVPGFSIAIADLFEAWDF